ncbi:MAG: MOSC domain-containing protein, partial [Pseudomonadota bacterium]
GKPSPRRQGTENGGLARRAGQRRTGGMNEAAVKAIYVGMPAPLSANGKTVLTGIVKKAVSGPVRLGPSHFEGDGQADSKLHGGEEKAAYAYPEANVQAWAQELGTDPAGLHFGENLRVTGLGDDDVCIGERFGIGEAVVEVTQPRLPCAKLGMLMGDPEFPARFLTAVRPGFYLRIVEPGVMRAGDVIARLSKPDHDITVARLVRLITHERDDRRGAAQALERLEWLDAGWRRRLRQLAEAP